MKLNNHYVNFLMLTCFAIIFSSCGSMEKVLPDRKKEYQYSSEIPPLEIPPELSATTIEQTPIKSAAVSSKVEPAEYAQPSEKKIEQPEVVAEPEKDLTVEAEDGGRYIEIEESYPIAWRMVGRALSRLEIEIDDLNRSEGLYYIIFRDQQNQSNDGGFWSGLAFWSSENGVGTEEEYQIKLSDNSGITELRVLDDEGVPQSEGTGLNVLKMIQKQVIRQQSEKTKSGS